METRSSYTSNGMTVQADWQVEGTRAWIQAAISTDEGIETVNLSDMQTSYVLRRAGRMDSEHPFKHYAEIVHAIYN